MYQTTPYTVERPWGYYTVLHEVDGMKVKELTVNPGCSLSMQRHKCRAEYWIVSDGDCIVKFENGWILKKKHDSLMINVNEWHQLTNPFDTPCKLVEVQYGTNCIEEDIERK